jgi:hypothetical protein
MSRVLLVTKKLEATPSGGREMLCKLNRDCLKDIFGDRFLSFEIEHRQIRNVKAIIQAFGGHIDGINHDVVAEALQEVAKDVKKVFVDGSNLGHLALAIKTQFPKIEVCTFFHNVEARFFLGSMKQSRTPHALAVLLCNYLAERKAVRYSDKLVALNERDSRLLRRVYGRAATHVSPIAIEDKFPHGSRVEHRSKLRKSYALFVGGNFYANRAGITWFVKKVVPRIQCKVCIVGRGFEDFRSDLERDSKVEVVGSVDSIAEWYLGAHFAVAPIYDGSGMKTKVAEALMFGKKIIGTPEAFTGYEDVADRAGWVCSTADEFVKVIGRADELITEMFDEELRACYSQKYSYSAARARLTRIVGPLN